ncbi:organic cation/carnitine transporter 3, partial [Prunus dulcis]
MLRLSGVETGPIRGVGCTGVWGDIVIVWYGRTWRRLSGVLTGPIRGVGSTGVWGDYVKYREMKYGIANVWNWVLWKNYVWLDPSVRVRRQPK